MVKGRKRVRITKEIEDRVEEIWNTGGRETLSYVKIGLLVNISDTNVIRVLKKRGLYIGDRLLPRGGAVLKGIGEEKEKQIEDLWLKNYTRGITFTEIGERVGVSTPTVIKVLKRRGVPNIECRKRGKESIDKDTKQKVEEIWLGGGREELSLECIGKKVGISTPTVTKILKKKGLYPEKRRKLRKKGVKSL